MAKEMKELEGEGGMTEKNKAVRSFSLILYKKRILFSARQEAPMR